MFKIGDRVYIDTGVISSGPDASHEIVGVSGDYLLICPIPRLAEIVPGQQTVPVTRITGERLRFPYRSDEHVSISAEEAIERIEAGAHRCAADGHREERTDVVMAALLRAGCAEASIDREGRLCIKVLPDWRESAEKAGLL